MVKKVVHIVTTVFLGVDISKCFQILKNQQGITRESAISIADVQKSICDLVAEREVLFRTPRNREDNIKRDLTETTCGKLW